MRINEEDLKPSFLGDLNTQEAGLSVGAKPRVVDATDQESVGQGDLIGDEPGTNLKAHQLDTWDKPLTRLCPRCRR